MRSRAVCAFAVILVTTGVSAFAQAVSPYWSSSCVSDRGVVRTGMISGSPGDPSSAKVISFSDFLKITYPNITDFRRRPSFIAPNSRTAGEGILYRLDHALIRGFMACHDSIAIQ